MYGPKVLGCKASPEEVVDLMKKYLDFVDYLEGGGVKAIQSMDEEGPVAEVRCTEKVTEIYLTTKAPEELWEAFFGKGAVGLRRCLGDGYLNVAKSHVSPKLFVTAEGTRGSFEALVTPEGVKAKGTCPFPGLTRIAHESGIKLAL